MEYSREEIESKAIRISATDGDKEIGHAFLFLITNDLHKEPYGLLEDLKIEEDFQGNGYGPKLTEEIIRVAKERGCYKLLATSRFSREHVHRMYEKLGFEKNGYDFRMNL